MKNWKTNLAALFTALVGVATAMGYISQEVAGAILTIGVTFGFAVAKDHNVSGKSKFSNTEEETESIGQPFPKKK